MDKFADWSGTLTKVDLVNPHSYLYFDTGGFVAGVLVPPTKNSDKLHVVERSMLDAKTLALKRE